MPNNSDTDVEVYQFRVWLKKISPAIWRRILVTSDTTIADFHYILQIVMDWTDYHLHRFLIRAKEYGIARMYSPYFVDNPYKVKLSDFKFRLRERFVYEYDFTDDWQLEVRLEKILPVNPKTTYPICVAVARTTPEEDCGGVQAYLEFRYHYWPAEALETIKELAEEGEIGEIRRILSTLEKYLSLDRFNRCEVNEQLQLYRTAKEEQLSNQEN